MRPDALPYAKPAAPADGVLGVLQFIFALMGVAGLNSPDFSYLAYQGLMGFIMLVGFRSAARVDYFYSRYLPAVAWRRYVKETVRTILCPYWLLLAFGVMVSYYNVKGARTVASYFYYVTPNSWQHVWLWVSDVLVVPNVFFSGEAPVHSFQPLSWWVGMVFIWALSAPLLYLFRDVRRLMLVLIVYYNVLVYGALATGSQYMIWQEVALRGLFSAALPFVAGLYVFRMRKSEASLQHGLVSLWIFYIVFQFYVFADVTTHGFFPMMLFSAWMLSRIDMHFIERGAFWWRHSCYFLGKLAYPMLLLCGPVSAVLWQIFPQGLSEDAIETVNMRYYWPIVVVAVSLIAAILVRMFMLFPLELLLSCCNRYRNYPSAMTPTYGSSR